MCSCFSKVNKKACIFLYCNLLFPVNTIILFILRTMIFNKNINTSGYSGKKNIHSDSLARVNTWI